MYKIMFTDDIQLWYPYYCSTWWRQ